MQILGRSTVELTPTEHFARGKFDEMLDAGHSIAVSAKRIEELFPGLDPAFYRWLRGEPLLLGT